MKNRDICGGFRVKPGERRLGCLIGTNIISARPKIEGSSQKGDHTIRPFTLDILAENVGSDLDDIWVDPESSLEILLGQVLGAVDVPFTKCPSFAH
jgi:hypothetical protein